MAVTDSPMDGRVLIALEDGPLVAEPTWTRFDEIADCRNYGYDANAGRQSELDETDTGNATVYFHDRVNYLDNDDLIGCQIMLQLYNPVLEEWQVRWRGFIDDIETDLVDGPPDLPLANVAMQCVGIFDYLGGCKMLPGIFGDPLPNPMAGVVFYEDGRVDDRIAALLTDALLDPDMTVIFTGHVNVNETVYNQDDVILQGLRDAADAEFPGVANVYEDRFGRVAFHGRFARFDPETIAAEPGVNWLFTRWYAATREDVIDLGVAQIREFGYNKPRSRIINTYTAVPSKDENGFEFDSSQIGTTLVATDSYSISKYGYRGRDATDLIIKNNFANGNTGTLECQLFGAFYVTSYALPRKAVQNIVFKSLRPDDDRAGPVWDLMCRADVSDAMNLTIDEANLDDEPFFVDGYSIEVRQGPPEFDIVTFTPNLTPGSYYADMDEMFGSGP